MPEIIAVSKTFSISDILPVINYGQVHFGENKVQEALEKWSSLKNDFNHIKLHMLGKLQTNKVKHMLPLFDYLHSLDNIKLAEKISLEEKKKNKHLKIFIQVNIGNEKQKGGIAINFLDDFYYYCVKELKINVIGLMAIPPNDVGVDDYFKKLLELNKSLGLKELSMGMSSDFKIALNYETTFVRIGSSIFGNRG